MPATTVPVEVPRAACLAQPLPASTDGEAQLGHDHPTRSRSTLPPLQCLQPACSADPAPDTRPVPTWRKRQMPTRKSLRDTAARSSKPALSFCHPKSTGTRGGGLKQPLKQVQQRKPQRTGRRKELSRALPLVAQPTCGASDALSHAAFQQQQPTRPADTARVQQIPQQSAGIASVDPAALPLPTPSCPGTRFADVGETETHATLPRAVPRVSSLNASPAPLLKSSERLLNSRRRVKPPRSRSNHSQDSLLDDDVVPATTAKQKPQPQTSLYPQLPLQQISPRRGPDAATPRHCGTSAAARTASADAGPPCVPPPGTTPTVGPERCVEVPQTPASAVLAQRNVLTPQEQRLAAGGELSAADSAAAANTGAAAYRSGAPCSRHHRRAPLDELPSDSRQTNLSEHPLPSLQRHLLQQQKSHQQQQQQQPSALLPHQQNRGSPQRHTADEDFQLAIAAKRAQVRRKSTSSGDSAATADNTPRSPNHPPCASWQVGGPRSPTQHGGSALWSGLHASHNISSPTAQHSRWSGALPKGHVYCADSNQHRRSCCCVTRPWLDVNLQALPCYVFSSRPDRPELKLRSAGYPAGGCLQAQQTWAAAAAAPGLGPPRWHRRCGSRPRRMTSSSRPRRTACRGGARGWMAGSRPCLPLRPAVRGGAARWMRSPPSLCSGPSSPPPLLPRGHFRQPADVKRDVLRRRSLLYVRSPLRCSPFPSRRQRMHLRQQVSLS